MLAPIRLSPLSFINPCRFWTWCRDCHVCCIRHFNEIGSPNLVSILFPSADTVPHASSTQTVAVAHRLIYLHRFKSETCGNVNWALLPHLYAPCSYYYTEFLSFRWSGSGISSLCLVEIPFQARSPGLSALPLRLAKGKGYFLGSQTQQ